MQLKFLSGIINEKITEVKKEMDKLEVIRHDSLIQIGNIVHESVPVSDDEENNRVERIFGDVKSKKKYSHVRQAFNFMNFINFMKDF